ncbi:MAG: FtsW/RodA/SpoVE family cell cycle protein [Peptococcaceae bacterium]|nr:FtsW/RodA/SpoVE family cell cycle protein [Peptococcaceae bacterium]
MKSFLNTVLLRCLALVALGVGWGTLFLQGRTDLSQLSYLGVFAGLIILGMVLEFFGHSRGDSLIFSVVLMIMCIGLVFVTRVDAELASRQLIWAAIGIVLYYGVVFGLKDYRRLGNYSFIWGLLALVLLIITLVFGVTTGGATRWLEFGGFTVQPEEMVKVCALLFLASYLNANRELLSIGNTQVGPFSLPGRQVIGPFLLLMALVMGFLAAQKSLGTAMVFFFLFVLLMYLVTGRKLYLVSSLPLAAICSGLGYLLFSHVRVRVDTWINPWPEATGGGFQISQSLFAISAGGLFGTGLGQGVAAYKVPVAETDFIFAVVAEETGFVGAMALIALFVILIVRCFIVSMRSVDRFGQILAGGIGILVAVETLVILAGVLKLFPLTGLVLPWVSYGGNSLILHLILLGLMTNMSNMSATVWPGVLVRGGEGA